MTDWCRVTLASGRVLPDGEAGGVDSPVFGLDGLSVGWGRDNAIDQPAATTVGLSVVMGDPPWPEWVRGELLAIGAVVNVWTLPYPADAPAGVSTPEHPSTLLGTNLCVNPSFEVNTSGWTTVRTALTRVASSSARSGGYVAHMVNDGAASTHYLAVAAGQRVPVTPGQVFTVSASARLVSGSGTGYTARIFFYDGSGAVVGSSVSGPPVALTPQWQSLSVLVPVPAGAVVAAPTVSSPSAVNADVWEVDAVMAAATGTPGAYFDGDSTDTDGNHYQWTGTAHASTSTRRVFSPADAGIVASARVTDVGIVWDDTARSAVATITAVDHLGQLESEPIGDEPWPIEALAVRLARLTRLTSTGVRFEIPPTSVGGTAQDGLGAIVVGAVDTDAQPAAGLAQDLAVAGDAAAWPVHGSSVEVPGTAGPLVWLRSNADRIALQTLHVGAGGTVIVGQPLDPFADPDAGWAHVSACWIPRDDASWGRSASTLVTRVSIGWLDASTVTPEEPDPTTRTESVVDVSLESSQGVHGVSYETLLTTAEDAAGLAARLLTRSSIEQWFTDGLRIDQVEVPSGVDPVYGDTASTLARLLVSHSRVACPVAVAELPAWVPAPPESAGRLLGYVEGGSYTFTGGRWILDLRLSAAGGGAPAVWLDVPRALPTWSWANVDRSVRWVDTSVPVEVV